MADQRTLEYLLALKADVSQASRKFKKAMKDAQKEGKLTGAEMHKLGKTTQTLGEKFSMIMGRAALTIPVWLALRAAVLKVRQAVGGTIKYYQDLDKGMRKVMAVATYTANTQAQVYSILELKAKNYSIRTSRGISEITEAMYQLGTAGRSTMEIMTGFEHIMNLAIGTFGDTATAGKVVSGMLNVFEHQLIELGGTATRIKYVSDILADAWKNNQIELNELFLAMSYLASAGNAVNMEFEQLVSLSSVMSDSMLRGGKGGRLLARSLVEISKDAGKLQDMGIMIDSTKALDFYDVMKQLREIYIKQGGSLQFLADLTDVFGTRAARAVLSVIQQWEKWNKEIDRTKQGIEGTAETLADLAEKSWADLFKRWGKALITSPDIGKGRSFGKEGMAGALKLEYDYRKNMENLYTTTMLFKKALKLTREEAEALVVALHRASSPKMAYDIGSIYGVERPGAGKYTRPFKKGEEASVERVLQLQRTFEQLGLLEHIEPAMMEITKETEKLNDKSENLWDTWIREGKSVHEVVKAIYKLTGGLDVNYGLLKKSVEMRMEEIKLTRLSALAEKEKTLNMKEQQNILKLMLEYEQAELQRDRKKQAEIEQVMALQGLTAHELTYQYKYGGMKDVILRNKGQFDPDKINSMMRLLRQMDPILQRNVGRWQSRFEGPQGGRFVSKPYGGMEYEYPKTPESKTPTGEPYWESIDNKLGKLNRQLDDLKEINKKGLQ